MEQTRVNRYLDRMEELTFRFMRHFHSRVEEQGCISPSQYFLMRTLSDQGSMTVSDMAQHLDTSVAGATGLIDRLEKAGWVDRRRDEADRRLVHVALTVEGKTRFTESATLRRAVMAEVLGVLTPNEMEQLVGLYEKIARLSTP
jgi:DNA-binding MarR family transcriptional regulator